MRRDDRQLGRPRRGDNLLINGCFRFWQRQTPATLTTHSDASSTGTYAADQWYHICEQASFQSARIAGTTQQYAANLKNDNANAQRIGFVQPIEDKNCFHLRGKKATLSLKVRSNAATHVRCSIVEWKGTANTITRDIVQSWGDVPTLIATGTYPVSNPTPSEVILVSGTWSDLVYTAELGSTFNNLFVLIYTETQIAQNVTVDLEAVQLELGEFATDFELVDYETMLSRCERYFEKTFDVDTTPQNNVAAGANFLTPGNGGYSNSYSGHVFRTRKAIIPSIVYYNPSAATPATWSYYKSSTRYDRAPTTELVWMSGFSCSFRTDGAFTLNHGHYTAEAVL